jgi:hypothetical protein
MAPVTGESRLRDLDARLGELNEAERDERLSDLDERLWKLSEAELDELDARLSGLEEARRRQEWIEGDGQRRGEWIDAAICMPRATRDLLAPVLEIEQGGEVEAVAEALDHLEIALEQLRASLVVD